MEGDMCESIGQVRLALQEKWANDQRVHELCALLHRIHRIRAQRAFHSHRATSIASHRDAKTLQWSEPVTRQQPWLPSSNGSTLHSKNRMARLGNLKRSPSRDVAENSVASDGQLPSRQVSLLQCKLLGELHDRLFTKFSFKAWRVAIEYAKHVDEETDAYCTRTSQAHMRSILLCWRDMVKAVQDHHRKVCTALLGQCFFKWQSWARAKVRRRDMEDAAMKRYHANLTAAALVHMRVWLRAEELDKIRASLATVWWSHKARTRIWRAWRRYAARISEQRKRLVLNPREKENKRRLPSNGVVGDACQNDNALAIIENLKACIEQVEGEIALFLTARNGRSTGLRWRGDIQAFETLNVGGPYCGSYRTHAAYDPQRYCDGMPSIEDEGGEGMVPQRSTTHGTRSESTESLPHDDLDDSSDASSTLIEECQMYNNRKLLNDAITALKMAVATSELVSAEAARRFCLIHLPKAVDAWRKVTFQAAMQEDDRIDALRLKVSFRAWNSSTVRSLSRVATGMAIQQGRARRLMRNCLMELAANAEEGRGIRQFERLCLRRIFNQWLQQVEAQRRYSMVIQTVRERKKLDLLKLAVTVWRGEAAKDALLRRVFSFAFERWEERWQEENPGVEKCEAEFDLLSRCLLAWQLLVLRAYENHRLNDLSLVADQYRRRNLLSTAFGALREARLSFDGRYLSLTMIPFARNVFAAWRARSRFVFREQPDQMYAQKVLRRLLHAWKYRTTEVACKASLFWVRWRIDGLLRSALVAWYSHARAASRYRRHWEDRQVQAQRLQRIYSVRDGNSLSLTLGVAQHQTENEPLSSDSTSIQTVIYSR